MNSVGAAGLASLTGGGGSSCSSSSSSPGGGAAGAGGMPGGGGGGGTNTGPVGAGDPGIMASHLAVPTSDDDDDEMPSSPGSFDDDDGSFNSVDDVTAQLAAAGGWTGETRPTFVHSMAEGPCVGVFQY